MVSKEKKAQQRTMVRMQSVPSFPRKCLRKRTEEVTDLKADKEV